MSQRIQKIKETYSEQFKERLEHEKVDISLDSAWDILASADPSHNKKNVRWLVETYINHGFLWEDIAHGNTSKVSETLTEFDRHKRNLEPSERSLNKYQELGNLWSAIKPYIGQLTAGEEKKSEKDKAYSESRILYEDDMGMKIVSPLTEYASKWWGRGTRWCTAAEKNNMFAYYNEDAPLIIVIMPNGDKLQMHIQPYESPKHERKHKPKHIPFHMVDEYWMYETFMDNARPTYNIQFMNDADANVTDEYIEEHKDVLQPLLIWKDTYGKQNKSHSKDLYHEDVVSSKDVKKITEKPLSDNDKQKLLSELVYKDGRYLEYVPEELITENMCLEAVRQDARNVRYIPSARVNQNDMNELAQTEDLLSLMWYGKTNHKLDLFTSDLIKKLIDVNYASLHYIEKFYLDAELCDYAVDRDIRSIIYIHREDIDLDIYKKAIRQYPNLIDENSTLIKELCDKEICDIVLENSSHNIKNIPENFFTDDFILRIINKDATLIRYIPDNLLTPSIYNVAIQKDLQSIKYFPKKDKGKYIEHYAHAIHEDTFKEIEETFASYFDAIYEEINLQRRNQLFLM